MGDSLFETSTETMPEPAGQNARACVAQPRSANAVVAVGGWAHAAAVVAVFIIAVVVVVVIVNRAW